MTIEVTISDLFKAYGYSFDWEKRVTDQDKLIERIHDANKDILNSNSLKITHIADELKEFCQEHAASLNYLEYVFDRLQEHGVTLV